MDFGAILLLAFFAWLAWLALRQRKGESMVCKACGNHGETREHTKGSILIEIVLWLCFIIPGLIYSIWRHSTRKPACTACGSDELVPPHTPVGRKIIAEHEPKA